MPVPFNFWGAVRGPPPVVAIAGAQVEAGASASLTAGLRFLPTFFGLHLTNTHGEPNGEPLSPEQAQQALLSRLLLLLGSMVILCLLLF